VSHRALTLALVLVSVGGLLWHRELYTVQRPGDAARDLASIAAPLRVAAGVDCVLPAVPIGMRRLRADDGAVLVHYWAPWQQGAYADAAMLDSLRRMPGLESVRIVIVCFDPFPSVARYVARRRLTLPVLLDTQGELRARLPCPSLPYTYVLDPTGRVAVRQPGRVDWLSRATRSALQAVGREPARAPAPPPAPPA